MAEVADAHVVVAAQTIYLRRNAEGATAIREAVIAGGSPAFLSRRIVARDIEAGNLAIVPVRDLPLRRAFRAVWIGSKNPPAGPVRDLVALARATAQRDA